MTVRHATHTRYVPITRRCVRCFAPFTVRVPVENARDASIAPRPVCRHCTEPDGRPNYYDDPSYNIPDECSFTRHNVR